MEEVKYLRGGRGGGGGTCGRKAAGGYVGTFMGEGRGRGRGRGGRVYRGNRFIREGKMRFGSMYRDQSKLDFTRKLQSSAKTTRPDELEEINLAVDCSNKEIVDSSGLATSDFRILPDKKYDEKIGVISSGVSSTEASEYCKSQGSSQNPSPIGCCQEKYSTVSNLYNGSKHSPGYKHKKDHLQNTYKGRKVFDSTKTEKLPGIKRKSFERLNQANLDSDEVTHIQEVTSLIINQGTSELPASEEKNPGNEEGQGGLNQIPNKDLNCSEHPIKDQDENNGSNSACEHSLNKLNPQIIGHVISWMIERQEEAIQWLKENGKYQFEGDTQISGKKPQRFSQSGGYRGKKQAWNGANHHAKKENHDFPPKYKSQKKNSSSHFSKISVNSLTQDKSDNSALENLELPQHQKNSELTGNNIPGTNFDQKADFRLKQRFGYNRRSNRERNGNFLFQNKTKEGESYCSSGVRSGSKWGEKGGNRAGSFNSSKYRDHHYRKQSLQKEL
ncbi:uncharacterized protein cubi_00705 [Cryptosporidium ubiquitum]|uniref:Uncharacterized protein n=1 Tax=Cryptosporidium ubiquitum TaxID=857276 RepID=A0A1J4MCE1_9CRYT|nr:uncharacterized protein cubi_00705 [Cryptosporidium ubiquitum]OII71897.1 hypothetical protein cubi_00705 [Cryptosporidium ubiquitum]